MTKTNWFDGAKYVPAHVGVYEVALGLHKYWDGYMWGALADSPEYAYRIRGFKSDNQNSDWRGLKEQVK